MNWVARINLELFVQVVRSPISLRYTTWRDVSGAATTSNQGIANLSELSRLVVVGLDGYRVLRTGHRLRRLDAANFSASHFLSHYVGGGRTTIVSVKLLRSVGSLARSKTAAIIVDVKVSVLAHPFFIHCRELWRVAIAEIILFFVSYLWTIHAITERRL